MADEPKPDQAQQPDPEAPVETREPAGATLDQVSPPIEDKKQQNPPDNPTSQESSTADTTEPADAAEDQATDTTKEEEPEPAHSDSSETPASPDQPDTSSEKPADSHEQKPVEPADKPAETPADPAAPLDLNAAHDTVITDQKTRDIEKKIEQAIDMELDRAAQPDRVKQLAIGLGIAMVVIWAIMGGFVLYEMFLQ